MHLHAFYIILLKWKRIYDDYIEEDIEHENIDDIEMENPDELIHLNAVDNEKRNAIVQMLR